MTERVAMYLLCEPMFEIVAGGFAFGSMISIPAILLGYAIGKALSLVDNT